MVLVFDISSSLCVVPTPTHATRTTPPHALAHASASTTCYVLHAFVRVDLLPGAAHPLRGPLLAPHAVPRDSPALAYY
jgi:hypothetical protein